MLCSTHSFRSTFHLCDPRGLGVLPGALCLRPASVTAEREHKDLGEISGASSVTWPHRAVKGLRSTVQLCPEWRGRHLAKHCPIFLFKDFRRRDLAGGGARSRETLILALTPPTASCVPSQSEPPVVSGSLSTKWGTDHRPHVCPLAAQNVYMIKHHFITFNNRGALIISILMFCFYAFVQNGNHNYNIDSEGKYYQFSSNTQYLIIYHLCLLQGGKKEALRCVFGLVT